MHWGNNHPSSNHFTSDLRGFCRRTEAVKQRLIRGNLLGFCFVSTINWKYIVDWSDDWYYRLACITYQSRHSMCQLSYWWGAPSVLLVHDSVFGAKAAE